MNVEVVVALEAHEIMPVALVVSEKEVLAVHAAVIPPPHLGLLDGLSLGVVIASERNPVFLEIVEYRLLSLAYYCFLILADWRCLF